jgi:TonB family protein
MSSNQISPSRGLLPRPEIGLLPVLTLVLWTSCLAIGALGIIFTHFLSKPPAPPAPIETELVNVETITPQAIQSLAPAQRQSSSAPPDIATISPPTAPPLFAQPVDHLPPKPAAPTPKPAVIHLTFGEGEGDQPAPVEPPEAVRDGEEGTVIVRMTVGQDGRVIDAQAVSPSRWPLLNGAAVQTIRNTWRFPKGPVRVYEVTIEFVINRQ